MARSLQEMDSFVVLTDTSQTEGMYSDFLVPQNRCEDVSLSDPHKNPARVSCGRYFLSLTCKNRSTLSIIIIFRCRRFRLCTEHSQSSCFPKYNLVTVHD